MNSLFLPEVRCHISAGRAEQLQQETVFFPEQQRQGAVSCRGQAGGSHKPSLHGAQETANVGTRGHGDTSLSGTYMITILHVSSG